MSIICGVLKTRGVTVDELEMRRLSTSTARYASGEAAIRVQGRIGMSFQPNASHERALMDHGPIFDSAGNIVCFDGRLDSFQELAGLLSLNESQTSDSSIALRAFCRWGKMCFSKFTGDWALSLWSNNEERLFLARDHAGARTLYLDRGEDGIRWSTYVDTFMSSEKDHHLSKEYAASYLSCMPLQDRTPYEGMRGVLPGHYIVIQDGSTTQCPHWSPLVRTTIRYKDDQEYDEHFLTLFEQSVARRTGPGAPILAQLSGGMDSTSIVCMSDHIRTTGNSSAELLDTISFFDDSESSLNERHYFTITEAHRGKTGIHLNTAVSQRTFDPPQTGEGHYSFPGADSFSILQERQLFHLLWKRGYRIILSGVGGDEMLGGIPVALPELAGHLVSGNVHKLLRSSLAWCLTDRSLLVSTLYETALYTLQLYATGTLQRRKVPPWLSPELALIAEQANNERPAISKRFGVAPHRLDNALTWWSVMETLPHLNPQILFRPEYRYPMLDKDLVTYLFSIPRDQLVRPGRRRAMMRRALRHIVPNEILERRRKAFQLRAPLSTLHRSHAKLQRLWDKSLLAEEQFIDADVLRNELKRCASGESEWSQALFKTIAFELWLRARHAEVPNVKSMSESLALRMSLAGSKRPASSV